MNLNHFKYFLIVCTVFFIAGCNQFKHEETPRQKILFDFDWKSTQSPSIGNGYIDLFILGEMFYQPYDFGLLEPGDHGWESKACQLDPEVMDFMSSDTFSQLVITESAFSCMVNAIS